MPILRPSGLTPSQLETLLLTNLLEISTGRDLGVLNGVYYSSDVPISRPSGLTPSQLENLFLTNLLKFSTGWDSGVLKGLRL